MFPKKFKKSDLFNKNHTDYLKYKYLKNQKYRSLSHKKPNKLRHNDHIIQRNISNSFSEYNPKKKFENMLKNFQKKEVNLGKAKVKRLALEQYKKNQLMMKRFCDDIRMQMFYYSKKRRAAAKIEKFRDKSWQIVLALYIVLLRFRELIDLRLNKIAEDFDRFSKIQKSWITLKLLNKSIAGKENDFVVSPESKKLLAIGFGFNCVLSVTRKITVSKVRKRSREICGAFLSQASKLSQIRDCFNEFSLQIRKIQLRFHSHKRVIALEEFNVRGSMHLWLKKLMILEKNLLKKAVKKEKMVVEREIKTLESIPEEFLKEFSKAFLDVKISQFVIKRWNELERVSTKNFDQSKIVDGYRGMKLHDAVYEALEKVEEINEIIRERYQKGSTERRRNSVRRTSVLHQGIIFKKIAKLAEQFEPHILALRKLDCMKRLVAFYIRNKFTFNPDRKEMRAIIYKCVEVYKDTKMANHIENDVDSKESISPTRKKKGRRNVKRKKKSSKSVIN